VGHFLKNKVDAKTGQPFQVTRAAMEALCAYEWPGNVRELENIIERACVLCEDNKIRTRDLPQPIQALTNSTDTAFVPRAPAPAEENVFPLNFPVDLPGRPQGSTTSPPNIIPLKDFIRDQETGYLNTVLAQTGGDKDKAARLLGISMATLYRKLAGEH
jgi:DNA-binding NtrC family response regulator